MGWGANGGNCARGRASWNRQVLGVAHFAEIRHQVDPYAWRILTKCATHKDLLGDATHKDLLGDAFLQNAPPLRVFEILFYCLNFFISAHIEHEEKCLQTFK